MAAEIAIKITGVNEADGALRDATRGVKDFDNASKGAGGGINAFREIAVGALREVGAAALNLAVQGGQALVGFLQSSVDAAGNFEASMNGFQAVTGAALQNAGFDLDDVSAKALQLGKDTAFSAQQSIQAMTELSKGGVPVVDIMGEATDATLALASAAGIELAGAAEIVAKQLGVWSETGIEATQVADLLASAANASTVGVDDLALGLANVGGQALTTGVSFEEVVQTLAAIAPGFSNAGTAGTSFKTFLARLVPTTGPAIEAMQELGLATEEGKSAFFDANGSFVGMEKTAQLLQDALAGTSEEFKSATLNAIFGSDAIAVADALARQGAEGYNAMGQSMLDAGGAATAAATMQQGYGFAMEQLGGSIETLQIILGSKLLPVITSVVDKFTGIANIAIMFADGDMFGALTGLGIWLSENVNPALGSFVTNLAIATNPLQQLKDGILSMLSQVAAALPGMLLSWAAALAGWVWAALPGLLSNLAGLLQSLLAWAMGAGATIRTALVQWAGYLGMWVQDAMPGLGANLAAFIQSFLTWIGAQLPGIVALLAIWGQRFSQWVIDAAPGMLRELGAFLASMLAWLMDSMPAIVAQLAIWGGQFVAWLVNVVPPLLIAAGTLLGELMGWLVNNLPAIQQKLKDWGKAFVEWVIASAPGLVRELGVLWEKFKGWMGETANKLAADGSVGRALVDGIKAGIASALGSLLDAARNAALRAIETSKRALGIASPSKVAAEQIGKPFMQGIAGGILQNTPMVASAGAMAGAASVAGAQSTTMTTNNNYYYSPTYSSTPSNPSADFAMMKTLAGV